MIHFSLEQSLLLKFMKKSICQNNNKHEVIYLAYGKMDFKQGIISKFCRLLPFLSKECYLGHLLHEGNSNCGGVLLMSRLQRTDACKAVCSACLWQKQCGRNSSLFKRVKAEAELQAWGCVRMLKAAMSKEPVLSVPE